MTYSISFSAGEYDLDKKEGTEVTIKVEKVFRHENYDPHHINNDITLLKLSSPVKFTKYVMPACLPTLDPKAGTNCYITGGLKVFYNNILYSAHFLIAEDFLN